MTGAPAFGPLHGEIEAFVALKRRCGFKYDEAERALARFDAMCADMGLGTDGGVTREMADAWCERLPGESLRTRSDRVCALRQFSKYLAGRGLDSHVPRGGLPRETPRVRVPTRAEVADLLAEADAAEGPSGYGWMGAWPGCMFRMMWCCGLRVSECCGLAWADVDLARGSLEVAPSKGGRARTVWMAADLAGYVDGYRRRLEAALGWLPRWCFPGRDPSAHLLKTSVERRFRQLWGRTAHSSSGKRPTPHSLRHAFVVERMNAWVAEGRDLEEAMPYLSAYLGHSSPAETMYYYHQVAAAFDAVRRVDSAAPSAIPEVVAYAGA